MEFVRAEDGEIEAGGAPARLELKAMICRGEYDSRRAARRSTTRVFVHRVGELIMILVQVGEVRAFAGVARRVRGRVNGRRAHADNPEPASADSSHVNNESS
jgi:hypothetical protein